LELITGISRLQLSSFRPALLGNNFLAQAYTAIKGCQGSISCKPKVKKSKF